MKTTKINLTAALALLDERKHEGLIDMVAELEAAVAAGRVPNKLLTDAKFIINRRVEETVEAFDDAEREKFWKVHPNVTAPHAGDVMVMGAYNVPAALKEMVKKKNEPRAALLQALMPLAELFVAAKPLIVKRGDGPTEKQIAAAKAREGHEMTCQCCARGIFAERGKIAHHGYERPGDGWQTASCMGAMYAPFETSRTRLADMIIGLGRNRDGRVDDRADVVAERRDIEVNWMDYSKRDRRGRPGLEIREDVARLNFDEITEGAKKALGNRRIKTFDDLKANEIEMIDHKIAYLNDRIKHEQGRYDGWKKTHEFKGGKWEPVT